MTLKNNRAPLLSNIKLCASFHCHMWIQTEVTVRKRLNRVMTSVTLTFDLWPFAWTSRLSMVITPVNFRMIRWQKHCQKGVTDGQTDVPTDRQIERSVLKAAWSQLKRVSKCYLWNGEHFVNTLELQQSCAKPSKYSSVGHIFAQFPEQREVTNH